MVEDAGGDVLAARAFAPGEGRETGQRDMHRRFGEVAAIEFRLRPGEMPQRIRRDGEAVSDGQQRQEPRLLARPLARQQGKARFRTRRVLPRPALQRDPCEQDEAGVAVGAEESERRRRVGALDLR